MMMQKGYMQQSTQRTAAKAAPFIPQFVMPEKEQRSRKKVRRYALTLEEMPDRYTLRTVTLHDGVLLKGAKIDLRTGIVTPHEYKDYAYKRPTFSVKAEPFDCVPPWIRIPASTCRWTHKMFAVGTQPVKNQTRGRRSMTMINTLKPHLQGFASSRKALSGLPVFDDIVTGVAKLDRHGNTRDLNKYQMTAMLAELDVISSDAVMEWMGCEKRHAQKIAACLRLIISMALPHAHTWPKRTANAGEGTN